MSSSANERVALPGDGAAMPSFLAGGGQMGALMRDKDWGPTPLGVPSQWPRALRTAIRLILNTGHPMYVFWGPESFCFYNDAYRASIGPERHPSSLGRAGREVWDEIWPTIGPQIEQVMGGGGPTWHENQLVPITRDGRLEDVYWTYSFGPIDDPDAIDGIGGVLVVCAETTATVLAERDRAAEADRQRRLFAQAPGFIIVMRGQDHVVDFVNDAHRATFGSDDWAGRPIRDAFPDIRDQGFLERLDGVYRSGQAFQAKGAPVVYRTPGTATPTTRFLDFVYAPLFDDAGQVTGVFCEGYDVTEQHVAQEGLKAREEQLRLATDAAEIGLWDIDVLTDTLYWPPRVKAMFGISADVPVSMGDFYAGLHPLDRDPVARAFVAALDPELRALYDVEYRTIGKEDGRTRWVAAKGRAVFDGDRCMRVIGTAIDITARKRIEEQLRDLNHTLERRVAEALAGRKILADIVEATDAFVQVVAPDYTWLAINRASAEEFGRIFGVAVQAGDNMLRVLASMPDHQAAVQAVWSRALAGEVFTEVREFGDPLHDRRFYEMKFDTLRDPDGSIIGAFQFVYDVTERLRAEARFRTAEEQLHQSQKLEAIGKLTGGVAHDFNNILMVISGGLSLLDRRDDPAQRLRITAGMKQAATRGASLARQLLTFSRGQALHPEVIDIARHLDRMRDLLDRTLRGDVQVRCEFDADLWPVSADVTQLELAVLNLCVNARDAMPKSGTVTIRATNAPDLDDDALHGDFVRLSVSDTGTGMPQDVIDRAFEPFFTTKEIGRGSGLGLAQVYGFAKQSGGSVELTSRPGEGTTVTFWLPRSRETPSVDDSRAVDVGRPADRRPSGTILLVEDDDEVAALVSQMLDELHYDVVRVSSADAALGALADGRVVDIVLSDIMMPGAMNGLALGAELRRRRPGLPILLTSGYSEAARDEAEAIAIEVLPKPYQLVDLQSALSRASHRGRARSGEAAQRDIDGS